MKFFTLEMLNCNWEFEDDFIFVIPGTEALHIWLVHWMY